MTLDIPYLLENMTLEEKAGLCSGSDFWRTKAVERLGLPAVMVSDGPHGLRKQADEADHLGLNASVPAVCFPAGSALACSFSRKLANEVGELLGEEARAEKIHTLLGPAINIKRSPLCGRNFEYLSEDPYLAGEIAASYIKGVQSKNVGVSVKHYAANNQETRRMSVDTLVDERTLREIYLKAFEIAVRQAQPWTLMCAYNKVNGTYCCENEFLLNTTLREEWGFDGIVMTDWGAMNNRVKALKAGLELEMPASHGINDNRIVEAVQNGRLPVQVLNRAVERLLVWIQRGLNKQPEIQAYDKQQHHSYSRKAAAECAVLLKNQNDVLPLAKTQQAVFIGPFAQAPRFQGGGSSHINCFQVTSAMAAAQEAGLPVRYYAGMQADGVTRDDALLQQAVEAAAGAQAAVLFVGLPDSFESEGYDRTHMDMPAAQNELIAAVARVQPNTIVVLHNGSPVTMPWNDEVAAVLEMYLGGQAVGGATVDLLYGDACPGGKLAETFPLRLQDNPSYLQFPGDGNTVAYGEGVFVGYRWYDSRQMQVRYPFGHGLSYTKFAIGPLQLSAASIGDGGSVTVTADVTNTGSREGSEVVQLYVAPPAAQRSIRPAQELKGFAKVNLQPGEIVKVSFTLQESAFAYYDTAQAKWYAAPGAYTINVGQSSRDIQKQAVVQLQTTMAPFVYADSTTIGDLLAHGLDDIVSELVAKMAESFGNSDAMSGEMVKAMMEAMPVHSLPSFTPISAEDMQATISKLKNL